VSPDDELSALALAADPDAPVDDDAVCLWDLTGRLQSGRLPEWYMPSPAGGAPVLRGWRRVVVFLVILSFLAITALGLCNTYGQLHLG
jgi:hypothetical protein